MPYDIDLAALHFTCVDKPTPRSIQGTRMVACDKLSACNRTCLAIFVKLGKGRLINSKRCDACLLCIRKDGFRRQPLSLCEFEKTFIVDGKIDRMIFHFNGMALERYEERTDKTNKDKEKQELIIPKLFQRIFTFEFSKSTGAMYSAHPSEISRMHLYLYR